LKTAHILKLAIPVPLSRLFDYLPPSSGPLPPVGSRVRVSFGRGTRVGLVMAHGTGSSVPSDRLKRVQAVLDETPLLSAESLWLLRFTSDYYHHPIGEVVATALPALLRQGKALHPVVESLHATSAGLGADIATLAKRAPRQAELLKQLIDSGTDGMCIAALNQVLPAWRRAARPLLERELVASITAPADEAKAEALQVAIPGPTLNADQQAAVDRISAGAGFAVNLLDGVTGSGKTEVYLRLIERTLAAGRQVLVLVPEIGLTPQLVSRFRARLGLEPALLHSALADTERLAAWRRARGGMAKLVVGTRSAVFAPMPELGLVVIDEEHDHSFKQQEGLRYSARDLAIARAKHADIPVILGSATPTLETQKQCLDDNYRRLLLPARAGGARPPEMRIVDVSLRLADDGIGDVLADAINAHLANNGQVLLFLNRRGYAPTLICAGCGELAECRRCDSRMTVHARDQQLRCHHCGASRPLEHRCSHCGAEMRTLGAGTERLEDALTQRFPGKAITRIDSDSTQGKAAMDEAFSAAAIGTADILVGTQMLSKGHHFPKLSLVGVINADQGLFSTDFRAGERLAQSIIQVAGRAGRERTLGEVLIQTAFPQHPFWQRLLEAGYRGISEDALKERATTHWPPFTRLALIRSTAHRRSDAHRFLELVQQRIVGMAAPSIRVFGPVDAAMARKAGRYRAQLLIQTTHRQALHILLHELRPALEDEPAARKVRWSIDVDPIEVF
jgi:primosomal protein N' (replication factor Y)